ncbi:odorant-binding protein-like [Muntiacus reevesi]|uniref:odorant-binding protein-like n=1 Tax=Muntiacus reevesi TaxID=9886 RepID=UPI0033079983
MKVLLFSLVLGLLVASEGEAQTDNSQFTGRWISHYNAADNVEKITEGGAFHTFMRYIEFDEENGTILFHFYVKLPLELLVRYAGNTEFRLISVDNNALIAHDINVDGNGKKTEVVQLFGSGDTVNSENIEKFNHAVREKGIPEENIRNIIDNDTCPEE